MGKITSELPPTSSAIKGHLLWAYYFINICFNILDTTKPKLQPVNFGWKLFNGMLILELVSSWNAKRIFSYMYVQGKM